MDSLDVVLCVFSGGLDCEVAWISAVHLNYTCTLQFSLQEKDRAGGLGCI